MKARLKQRLVLEQREVALIKALINEEKYNDQEVQAIFSHLGRSINHREIGFIRKNVLKYSHVDASKPIERREFLAAYKSALIGVKRAGAAPREAHFDLLLQAREAMLAAISVFNNPNINFRTEIFITNAVIAWTYLLHAYFLRQNVTYQYQNEQTPGGQPKYFELGRCLRLEASPVDRATKTNLEYLLELRHEIEHRMADDIDTAVSGKIQACALNFDHYLSLLFGEEYRIKANLPYSIQLSAISIDQRRGMKANAALPLAVEVVNRAFEARLSAEELNDPRYSYRVYLIPKTANRLGGADEAVEFIHPDSAKGEALQVALKEVEKHKRLPTEIVKLMRADGYRWFRQHELTLCVRELDAKNPKKGFGVELGKRWFWYEHFIDQVRSYCKKRGTL